MEKYNIGDFVRIKVTRQIGQITGILFSSSEEMYIVRTPLLQFVTMHKFELDPLSTEEEKEN